MKIFVDNTSMRHYNKAKGKKSKYVDGDSTFVTKGTESRGS